MINEKFIEKVKQGSILIARCRRCNNTQLATILYCLKCNSNDIEYKEIAGEGRVVTYTILNVAPEGYEQYTPYAWVIFEVHPNINVSGFLQGIKDPSDLPLNSKVKITGYDERGILLTRA